MDTFLSPSTTTYISVFKSLINHNLIYQACSNLYPAFVLTIISEGGRQWEVLNRFRNVLHTF